MKTITLQVNEEINLKPRYHGYNGGFSNINQCSACKMVGLYEDIHTVNPCFNCGGRVKQHGAGKWSGVWSNGFFSGGWSDGEWLIRTDR